MKSFLKVLVLFVVVSSSAVAFAAAPLIPLGITALLRFTASLATNDANIIAARVLSQRIADASVKAASDAAIRSAVSKGIATGSLAVWAGTSTAETFGRSFNGANGLYNISTSRGAFGYSSSYSSSSSSSLYSLGSANFGWSGQSASFGGGSSTGGGSIWFKLK